MSQTLKFRKEFSRKSQGKGTPYVFKVAGKSKSHSTAMVMKPAKFHLPVDISFSVAYLLRMKVIITLE